MMLFPWPATMGAVPGRSEAAGNQPPPSRATGIIIIQHPSPAPSPLGSSRERGWQLTPQLLCTQFTSRQIHHLPGLWLSRGLHPLGLGPSPGCPVLRHPGSAAAQTPGLASKILTEQARQCLKEEEEAIRELLAGKNPTFCAGQGACFPLAFQARSCRSKSSCFLFLPTQKFAWCGVSTELILPSFFFLLFLHPVLKQALQQTGSP